MINNLVDTFRSIKQILIIGCQRTTKKFIGNFLSTQKQTVVFSQAYYFSGISEREKKSKIRNVHQNPASYIQTMYSYKGQISLKSTYQ
jgi:hypothetical protein